MKKPNGRYDKIRFEPILDGDVIQMLHIGSYDDEPASFEIMDAFAKEKNVSRTCDSHREIYLSDKNRIKAGQLKTILRYSVRDNG